MPSHSVPPTEFPEPFAVEWGVDDFGIFQSFAVDRIVQRMRWIPPGTFMMGSPASEVGRSDDEVQHLVEMTQGYWLGDTPVTQALWEAVMGTNPSQFKAPDKPVEMVSWKDCQEFVARLNERVEGLEARLPTEAEWEYACRAGTTTATWVGDLQWGHAQEMPPLDAIAWDVANSAGSTHPVAQKAVNPWGLYDILGNVYEWCADWFDSYDVKTMQDPRGRSTGTRRVMRGGNWFSYTRHVRAADRDAAHPDDRYDYVGFRLARGPALRDGGQP